MVRKDLKWTGLLAMAALAGGAAPPDKKPLVMDYHRDGEFVEIRVAGHSDDIVHLIYSLSVLGPNNTSSKGKVTLRPGETKTVSVVRFRATGEWSARLDVSGDVDYSLSAPTKS